MRDYITCPKLQLVFAKFDKLENKEWLTISRASLTPASS